MRAGGNDEGRRQPLSLRVVVVDVLGSRSSRWCQVEVLGRQTRGGGSKLRGERSQRDPVNLLRIAGTFGLSGERITT